MNTFRLFRWLALLGVFIGACSFLLVSTKGKSPLADLLFNSGLVICATGVLGGWVWIIREKMTSSKDIENRYKRG